MRAALERGDWDEVGRQIADRVGQPQAPGARRHDAGDRRSDRPGARRPARRPPRSAAPAAAAACSATGRPRARAAIAAALAAGGARAARLPHRDRRPAAWITPRSRASSGRSPTCSRSRTRTRSRSARTATAPTSSRNHPHELSRARRDRPARDSRHRQGSRGAHPRDRRDRRRRVITASCSPSSRRRSSICCTCRASGPKTVATLYRELDVRTLDDLEQAARDGRIRALQGHGREEGSADPQGARRAQALRGPPSALRRARGRRGARRRTCASARRTPTIDAGRQPAARLRDLRRSRPPRHRRAGRR